MSHAEEEHQTTRRDFIYYATGATGAVATGAAVWPLINQMNPSADVQALSSIRVDVSSVEVGTQLTVKWLGKPVFIRRRTQAEIDESLAVNLDELPDDDARNENLDPSADASDANRVLNPPEGTEGVAGEWLVMMGVCMVVLAPLKGIQACNGGRNRGGFIGVDMADPCISILLFSTTTTDIMHTKKYQLFCPTSNKASYSNYFYHVIQYTSH